VGGVGAFRRDTFPHSLALAMASADDKTLPDKVKKQEEIDVRTITGNYYGNVQVFMQRIENL